MARQPKKPASTRSRRSDAVTRAASAPGGSFELSNSSRPFIAVGVFVFVALLFLCRLVYLQIIAAPEYQAESAATRTVVIDTTPRRGTIYDRNGNVLAVSVDAKTVYANPTEVEDPHTAAVLIASVVGGNREDYEELLTCGGPLDTFVYIKRKIDLDQAEKLEELQLAGVYFVDDTKREYPYGSVGAQVVGFCNVDGEGVCGLEYEYDDILKGSGGQHEYEVGLGGIPIAGGLKTGEEPVEGTDIMISIDIEFQRMVEEDCKTYGEWRAMDYPGAIVMDAATGEIYAACSMPYYNPNDLSEVKEGATQVKGITNAIEPGSIFKTISAMAILETGKMGTEDKIFCPAELKSDTYIITDSHERGDTEMTLREIIRDSSNVGISLATEENLGFDGMYEAIMRYHMNDATGVDYPGDNGGYLIDFDNWSRTQGYNITFGQGISMTPLQLVRFYGALLNNGAEVTPHFLIGYPQTGEIASYESEQVIQNTDAIDDMVSMLETVVTDGTGKDAQIDGFKVAGKTGTAEVANPEGGYYEDMNNLGFVGFLADSSSTLVCYAGADMVPYERNTTGLFNLIMTDAIDRYRIVSKEG